MLTLRPIHGRYVAPRAGRVFLAVGIVLGGAGCAKASEKISEKAAEKAIERETGGKVDIDVDGNDGKVKVETPDGSFSSGGDKVPDTWPDDVPLPDDLSEVAATETNTDAQAGIQIQAETQLSAAEVIALYRDGLQGWEADSQSEAIDSEAKSLSAFFEKGERKLSAFSNETAGDKTLVSLTYVDAGGS